MVVTIMTNHANTLFPDPVGVVLLGWEFLSVTFSRLLTPCIWYSYIVVPSTFSLNLATPYTALTIIKEEARKPVFHDKIK